MTETTTEQTAHEEPDNPTPPVCAKCGHPVMRSWGGWGHAPGRTDRRRHVVVVAADVTPS